MIAKTQKRKTSLRTIRAGVAVIAALAVVVPACGKQGGTDETLATPEVLTEAPELTVTPESTEEVKATVTTKPTATPKPTVTPAPTKAPEPLPANNMVSNAVFDSDASG